MAAPSWTSAFPDRGEESVGAVEVRKSPKSRGASEIGGSALESGGHFLVLGAVDGAGRVHQALAGERRGQFQQLALEARKRCERGRVDAPARIGSAAQDPELGAGRIHQDAVGRARAIEDLDVARGASAGSTRAQPIQALPVHVVRQHPRPLGRQQKGLSARPSAEVEDGLAGLRPDEQAQELAAFVLRLEEPLAPGVRAEQIGPGRRDPQGIGSPGAQRRRWPPPLPCAGPASDPGWPAARGRLPARPESPPAPSRSRAARLPRAAHPKGLPGAAPPRQYVACATGWLPVPARQRRNPHLAAMDDPRQLLEEGRFEELVNEDHPLWRGLALLELKRWADAARTFEEAPEAGQS